MTLYVHVRLMAWLVLHDADSIEANVETAAVSVDEGVDQLRQARRSQVSSTVDCVS